MINVIVMEGRIVQDIDLKHLGAKGTPCVNNTIVCNWWTGKAAASTYMDFVVWGKVAENLAKYCRKGSKITLKGHMATNSYTNQQGMKINKLVLNVEELSLDPRESSQHPNVINGNNATFDQSIEQEGIADEFSSTPNIDIDESSLPFY